MYLNIFFYEKKISYINCGYEEKNCNPTAYNIKNISFDIVGVHGKVVFGWLASISIK